MPQNDEYRLFSLLRTPETADPIFTPYSTPHGSSDSYTFKSLGCLLDPVSECLSNKKKIITPLSQSETGDG